MSDQRLHPRASLRTLVTVLVDTSEGRAPLQVFKGWTEDLSASGMQLACNDELPQGRVFARILLPGLDDKVVECQILRSSRRAPTGFRRSSGPQFVYGVRFVALQPQTDFERTHAIPDEAARSAV